eukprot:170134-Rhodomonas_salina.1
MRGAQRAQERAENLPKVAKISVPPAPTYCPTEEEFADPLGYIESIELEASRSCLLRAGNRNSSPDSLQFRTTRLCSTPNGRSSRRNSSSRSGPSSQSTPCFALALNADLHFATPLFILRLCAARGGLWACVSVRGARRVSVFQPRGV